MRECKVVFYRTLNIVEKAPVAQMDRATVS